MDPTTSASPTTSEDMQIKFEREPTSLSQPTNFEAIQAEFDKRYGRYTILFKELQAFHEGLTLQITSLKSHQISTHQDSVEDLWHKHSKFEAGLIQISVYRDDLEALESTLKALESTLTNIETARKIKNLLNAIHAISWKISDQLGQAAIDLNIMGDLLKPPTSTDETLWEPIQTEWDKTHPALSNSTSLPLLERTSSGGTDTTVVVETEETQPGAAPKENPIAPFTRSPTDWVALRASPPKVRRKKKITPLVKPARRCCCLF